MKNPTIDPSNRAATSGASQFPERFFCTVAARGKEPRYRLYAATLPELRAKMRKAGVRIAPIYDVQLRGRIA